MYNSPVGMGYSRLCTEQGIPREAYREAYTPRVYPPRVPPGYIHLFPDPPRRRITVLTTLPDPPRRRITEKS